jgi:elongation factor G
MRTNLQQLRNVGIIAHVDAGKTTLTERILYYSGAIHAIGEVHHGAATTDSSPEEQRHGITISSAATTVQWRDHAITLIDTPGHVDFTAEVVRSLRVLDGAVVVLDAVAGVEPQTEAVWRQADRHRVPRVCFVNKLDRAGADFTSVVSDIAGRLSASPVPVVLPIGREERFRGIVDVIDMTARIWPEGRDDHGASWLDAEVPAELADQAEAARAHLLEVLADHDDALLTALVEGRRVPADQLRRALRQATLAGAVTPVLCGSAFRNRGVQPLLDAVVDYLPSPADVPPVEGVDPRTGGSVTRPADPSAPLAGLVFKLQADEHVGQLTYVRVYSGTMRAKDTVLLTGSGVRQRVARVFRMQAADRLELEAVSAGAIAAVAGLRAATTGDSVCDPGSPVLLEVMEFPEPVVAVVVEARSRADSQRLGEALARLVAEDPTLRLRTEPETGELLLAGMGELHVQMKLDRMAREFGVRATAGKPQVSFRETLGRAVQSHRYRFKRQRGGPGQFAEVELTLQPTGRYQPREDEEVVEFVNAVKGGSIPAEFIPAVEAGVRAAANEGVAAGYPVVGVRAVLTDGAFHEQDSSPVAFQTAGALAFKEAVRKAGVVVLEPVMDVEVLTPEEHLGDVLGDLSGRRGRIAALDAQAGGQAVRAQAPLAELFGYADDLRSLTRGRASFTMRPATYQPAPQ